MPHIKSPQEVRKEFINLYVNVDAMERLSGNDPCGLVETFGKTYSLLIDCEWDSTRGKLHWRFSDEGEDYISDKELKKIKSKLIVLKQRAKDTLEKVIMNKREGAKCQHFTGAMMFTVEQLSQKNHLDYFVDHVEPFTLTTAKIDMMEKKKQLEDKNL